MSGKMIGIDNIIENEVYTILVFISIEFIREEKSQRSIAKENAMVCVSFIRVSVAASDTCITHST